MLRRKRGCVVNIGSGSATIVPADPLYSVYAGTKAYVEALTRVSAPRQRRAASRHLWHHDVTETTRAVHRACKHTPGALTRCHWLGSPPAQQLSPCRRAGSSR